MSAPISRAATSQPRMMKIGSGPAEPSAGGAKNVNWPFV